MPPPRIVFVTGGNHGIGYETVKALLQSTKPYHILLGSRSIEKGRSAIDTLRKECSATSNTVEAVQVDISSDESIEEAFKQVQTSPGCIDILINNAGAYTNPTTPEGSHHLQTNNTLRRQSRPGIHRRRNVPPRLFHKSLRRERLRHARPNLDNDAPSPEIQRSASTIRSRTVAHDGRSQRAILPDAAAASGVAQEY